MVNYTPDLSKNSDKTICIKDIMVKPAVTFKVDSDIMSAMKEILDKHLTGAPVLDDHKKVIGWLSEKDCLRYVTEAKYYNNPPEDVGHFMSKSVVSLEKNDNIFNAIELFTRYNFQSYPVISDDIIIGVVTRRSVLEAISKLKQTTW